ncbi:LysM domain-containing protein [Sorangium sp. So ce1014]|uniref:LysM peptidoglycan-binding domain-containing protein n=2 Tax=unclassified Sorangium TaxID=2621164 RepID=UPI003F5D6C0B
MSSRQTWFSVGALAATMLAASAAAAFPHVVREGETLAQIAERTYGRVQMEQVLVAANALDAGAGVPIMPGLRLEVPALGHHRVTAGETWAILAERMLGAADRSDVLALSNDTMPWIEPSDGQEIIVPYNLRYVVGQNDTLLTIAYRFLGKRDKAWMLHKYNHFKKDTLRRGAVILVPLTDLPLTTQGKAEAANAGALVRSEGAGRAREAQRRVDAELPQLASDVRSGRYIDAVARASRLLGYGELARMQIATLHRHLLEAYVALDAAGLAETACAAWREHDPTARLDPIELSPKIVSACTSSTELHLRLPPPEPAPPNPADAGGAR